MTTNPDVYANPGEDHLIDTIDPTTGLTSVFGSTEADIRERHPRAQRISWETWRAQAAARQQTPIVWTETTPAQYDERLNVLPPALWRGGAFLVGEPTDHDLSTGQPRFAADWHRGNHYVTASRPLTCAELRGILAVYR